MKRRSTYALVRRFEKLTMIDLSKGRSTRTRENWGEMITHNDTFLAHQGHDIRYKSIEVEN